MKVSRAMRQRPVEFVRLRAWTAAPARFRNGVSAVTSLCLVDESSAGGPPLLIAGDEDGGVSVRRVPSDTTVGVTDAELWSMRPGGPRTQLHDSCVNSIKLLPQQRGFVCAGDDGVVSAVATLEAASGSDIRKAATALVGHRGFVTDCDASSCGQAILSSSTDGTMLIWDPMAANTPVASVTIGRPVNSACFSAGDPYALVCAPELDRDPTGKGTCGVGRGKRDDLVEIWDIRSLRCFRDAIPAALATAFAEPGAPHQSPLADIQPTPQSPQAPFPSIWAESFSSGSISARVPRATKPAGGPSWLAAALGSPSVPSPATPLLRRSVWADDSSDVESLPTPSTRCPLEKENAHPDGADGDIGSSEMRWKSRCHPHSVDTSGGGQSADTSPSLEACSGGVGDRRQRQGTQRHGRARAPVRDEPALVLDWATLPSESSDGRGCLHGGDGTIWLPGGKTTLCTNGRRRQPRVVPHRRPGIGYGAESGDASTIARQALPKCDVCSEGLASVYSVQVSSDGRGILTASRDAIVTLWDAQSRRAVYRFGHPQLSTRARPILWDDDSSTKGYGGLRGEEPGGGSSSGKNRVTVLTGMRNGEVRPWRVGSRFPNRVFKPGQRYEGFEITCLASSRDGSVFASADFGGNVRVQSATAGRVSEL